MSHIPTYNTVEQLEHLHFEYTEITKQVIEGIDKGMHVSKE